MSNLWTPVKRSPVHHKLKQLGAILEPISQWQCVRQFRDPDQEAQAVRSEAGLLDLSFTTKWELKGKEIDQFLHSDLNQPAPQPGRLVRTDFGYLIRITRNHSLLVAEPEDDPLLLAVTGRKSQSSCLHLTDRSSGLGHFLLCGPRAGQVLGKLVSLDLREAAFPNLGCACTPLAHTPTTVLRRDRNALPGFEILFRSEFGEYLWDSVMEAGAEFEMAPFGLAALRLLER
jgi:heterotetrameric sarcosine oxidase gamma subunit